MLDKVVSIHKNNSHPLPFIDEQTKAQIKIQTDFTFPTRVPRTGRPTGLQVGTPACPTGPATGVGEEQCEAERNSLPRPLLSDRPPSPITLAFRTLTRRAYQVPGSFMVAIINKDPLV